MKSLREGQANLQRAYGEIRDGEAWLVGAHIADVRQRQQLEHDPDRAAQAAAAPARDRLALRARCASAASRSCRPLYFKDGHVKVELAVASGKEAQ